MASPRGPGMPGPPDGSLGNIGLRVVAADAIGFGVWPGDIIVIHPGNPEPVAMVRTVPVSFAALGAAIAAGGLVPLVESPSFTQFRQQHVATPNPSAKDGQASALAAARAIRRGGLALVR